jgi:hypothetical protein
MKTIYDGSVREEIIARIRMINEESHPMWGKMTVFQMLKHCSQWEDMVLHGKKYKRVFVGWLFGRIALKSVLKEGVPLRRNTPTIPELVITGNGSIPVQKEKWIALVEEHGRRFNPEFIHPFFGKMTQDETGVMAYKHSDHHLRQFGC